VVVIERAPVDDLAARRGTEGPRELAGVVAVDEVVLALAVGQVAEQRAGALQDRDRDLDGRRRGAAHDEIAPSGAMP
jgi:hypothetical protein